MTARIQQSAQARKTLGQRIKSLRRRKGWSQLTLASECGLSPTLKSQMGCCAASSLSWLAGILFVLIAVISFMGLQSGITLEQLTLAVLAPISPILLWGIREFRAQGEAADTSDRLRENSRMLWTSALERHMQEEDLRDHSRRLQDEIYNRRVTAPVIFNWIYNLL